ncbi:MAG: RNA polymerase sigma factor [Lachnospiraceae bacterium]|nr:RNA polymerase sigma factor [Lachnospiraceae bacterium]
MHEDKLIRKAKQGDADAVEELIAIYYPEILKYCFWHVPNHSLAEDATQETFLKAIRYMDTYTHKRKFKAFLYKIASNTCIDMRRKKYTQETSIEEDLLYMESGFKEIEEDMQLRYLVKNLKAEWQEIIILRFAQNLTMREIASILDIPLRTVQSRLRAALKQLKSELEKGEKR